MLDTIIPNRMSRQGQCVFWSGAMKLSHAGIHVVDFDRMVSFYQQALGLVVTDSLPGKLAFLTTQADDHHQIVLASGRPAGISSRDLLNQISFQLYDLQELQDAYYRLLETDAVEISPVTHGTAWAIYFRDPEDNRLEMFVETPWYISQPHLTEVDMTKPVDQIYAETEALCRSDPSFITMDEWREKFVSAVPVPAH
jgi:catechol 2,3-dioxygenase